ncbi:hypothetical protein [Teredinibacter franksiae]|uniref:hypothetical protein n=1 Tax=Teredinibacter franksiae TaxID=2761453 RepID=UPI001FE35493|nr:hypothetical protein [Teredinibacter franksiae]
MNTDSEKTKLNAGATAQPNNAVTNDTLEKAITTEADKLIVIGQQRIHVNAVTTKILADIAFLEDRIARMDSMKNPSETVLNTYRAMLTSRKSVLKWLQEHNMIVSETAKDRTGT